MDDPVEANERDEPLPLCGREDHCRAWDHLGRPRGREELADPRDRAERLGREPLAAAALRALDRRRREPQPAPDLRKEVEADGAPDHLGQTEQRSDPRVAGELSRAEEPREELGYLAREERPCEAISWPSLPSVYELDVQALPLMVSSVVRGP